jgi:predicted amidohydrolase
MTQPSSPGSPPSQAAQSSLIKVAAIQPRLEMGAVEANLRRVEDLIRQAHREHAPDLIVAPEGMTSPNLYGPSMRAVARPVGGEPYRLLTRLARELGCTVGGGFIAVRGCDTRGTYVLAEPDGTVHLHDKDQPSLWENNYYTRGRDDGIFTTGLGTVGCPMGFEWLRSRTARRLRGRIGLLAGGSCWWSYPDWPLPLFARDHQYNIALAREMAGRLARAVGAPAAIASHVGAVRSGSPLMPGVPWRTLLVGETQIVDADGRVQARLSYDDGEGYVAATVSALPASPLDPVPSGFWMTAVPATLHAVWHLHNAHGRVKYQITKRRGAFPWQSLTPGDLPNYVPGESTPTPATPLGQSHMTTARSLGVRP